MFQGCLWGKVWGMAEAQGQIVTLAPRRPVASVERLRGREWRTDAEIARLVQKSGRHPIGPRTALVCARAGKDAAEMRYMRNGRARTMGCGSGPDILVADIRSTVETALALLHKGNDPLDQKAAKKQADALAEARSITFADAAEKCITAKASGWRNASTPASGAPRWRPTPR